MSVAVNGVLLEMVKTAQVKNLSLLDLHFHIDLHFKKAAESKLRMAVMGNELKQVTTFFD